MAQALSHGVYRQTDSGEFRLVEELRCREISLVAGPEVGTADLAFFAFDGRGGQDLRSIFRDVSPDDAFRVRSQGRTIFSGVVARRRPAVQADSGEASVTLMAAPSEDNLHELHTVTGRLMVAGAPEPEEGEEPAPAEGLVVEAADLPPVFNSGGYGNRSATRVGTPSCHAWTHDGDPAGQLWTVAQALETLVARWGAPEPRSWELEAETGAAILAGFGEGPTWLGLDSPLPETAVLGLGILDAIAAVCEAGGFDFSLRFRERDVTPDWEMAIYRKNAGRPRSLRMPAPGTVRSLRQAQRSYSHNAINLDASSEQTRTVTRVLADDLIETTVELRPLWTEAEVLEGDVATLAQAEPGDAFFDRHVLGGAEFAGFGHVGRRWGLASTGTEPGYAAGDYAHPGGTAGFDWLAHLGTADSPMELASAAAGLVGPIRWARRPRPFLPLRREGLDRYLLEASEDGGQTWATLPLEARYDPRASTLDLQGLGNLAEVGVSTLTFAADPAPATSWWAAMTGQGGYAAASLRLRLTCCVVGDHAGGARSGRRPTAGVARDRLAMTASTAVRVWAAPGSRAAAVLGEADGWQLLGVADAAGERAPARVAGSDPIEAQSTRLQDGLDGLALRGSAWQAVPQFGAYLPGDRIEAIDGIDLSLHLSRTDIDRSPTVAGWRLVLWPDEEQGLFLELADADTVARARAVATLTDGQDEEIA